MDDIQFYFHIVYNIVFLQDVNIFIINRRYRYRKREEDALHDYSQVDEDVANNEQEYYEEAGGDQDSYSRMK